MAKRTPRSEANEAMTGARGAKPRGRSRAAQPGEPAADTGQPADIPDAQNAYAASSDEAGDEPNDQGAMTPSEDDIRMRAYHRYLERGGGHGMDFDDWLEAERDLKQRR